MLISLTMGGLHSTPVNNGDEVVCYSTRRFDADRRANRLKSLDPEGQVSVPNNCLRHSAAMELLQRGVGSAVIALWLGHESVETMRIYLHADLIIKEKAMASTRPVDMPSGRHRPSVALLGFLKGL